MPTEMANKRTLGIGIMSGTSIDSLDIALIEFPTAPSKPKLLQSTEYPYPSSLRETLLRCCDKSQQKIFSIDEISQLNAYLGLFYGNCINSFIKETGYKNEEIDFIGSHGQTFSHTPNKNYQFLDDGKFENCSATLQLGDGDCIAKTTGITTVTDFRMADIALGGEGAPLAPACHKVFFSDAAPKTFVINLGGIANITFINNKTEELIAFDTGPANMVMDALVSNFTNGEKHFDKNGKLAKKGKCNKELLNKMLQHPYFGKVHPKSCGRLEFGETFVEEIKEKGKGLSNEDLLRTALELTVANIKKAVSDLLAESTTTKSPLSISPKGGTEKAETLIQQPFDKDCTFIIMGGGAKNRFLLNRLQEELTPASVKTSDAHGVNSSAFESLCFGWLGYLTLTGQPYPGQSFTGAKHEGIYGKISPGNSASLKKPSFP